MEVKTNVFKSISHACEKLNAKPDQYTWFKDEMERIRLVWRLKYICYDHYCYIQETQDGFITLEVYKALEHEIHRREKSDKEHQKIL